jgi:hypothetical protein
MTKRPRLSVVQVLEQPGVAGCADLAIGYAKDFEAACKGLEKIANGQNANSAATAQIMREIALETLRAVRYGPYA